MQRVSDDGTNPDEFPEGFRPEDLFGGDPSGFLQQLMGMLSGGASGGFDQATNMAMSIAAGGSGERNVDPVERMSLEQLARVAELQIAQATGLRTSTSGSLTIAPVTRTDWVKKSMQAYRPILELLATSMTSPQIEGGADPEMAMLEQMFASLRPMMVSMTTGSMVGHLGSRALGTYDIPLPRAGSDELLVVVPNLNDLGEEWSLDAEDLRLWIALSEVAHHAVLIIPHVAERMNDLLRQYTEAFDNDPSALLGELGDFEPSGDFMEMQQQLQSMLGDPSSVLGKMRSDRQTALLPEMAALTAAIVGYVDHIMDSIGASLISSYGQLTEALRRRRVTTSESDRFVERLLGLELDQNLYDQGRSFVDGVVERAGEDGLAKLWESAESLPTPNEIGAPGLWLSRLGVDFELDVEIDESELDQLLKGDEEE